jgi:hypothetical protein
MIEMKSVAAITHLADAKVALRLNGLRHETAKRRVKIRDHSVFAEIR